jgi:hypothetical protein
MFKLLKIILFLFVLGSCHKNASENKVIQTDILNQSNVVIQVKNNPNYLDSLESILYQKYYKLPDELFKQYGHPLSILYDTLWNPYYHCTDTIMTIQFPGFTVKLHHVVGDGRYLFNGVTLKDSVILSDRGLTRGILIDSLESALNKSHRKINFQNGLILEYIVDETDAESYLQFKCVNKKFIELEYLPWMD